MAAVSLSREEQDSLVEAVKQGRQGAFEHLYEVTHVRLFALAAHIVGDREEAADITQEVYMDVLRQLPTEDRYIRLEPWLFRLATNTSYDHLRRRATRAAAPLAEDLCPATADHLERAHLAALLKQSLASLTPRYRTAVVLKDVCGVSTVELAEVMGVSPGSAAVLLFRARAAFRRAFRESAPAEVAGIAAVALLREMPELTPPPHLTRAPALTATLHARADAVTVQHAPHLRLAAHAGRAALHRGFTAPEPSLWNSLAPLADVGSTMGAKVVVIAVAIATVAAGGAAGSALTTGAPGPVATVAVAAATAPVTPAAMPAPAPASGASGGGVAPGPQTVGDEPVAEGAAGATQTVADGTDPASGPVSGTAGGGVEPAASTPGGAGPGTGGGAGPGTSGDAAPGTDGATPHEPGGGQGGNDGGAGSDQGGAGPAGDGTRSPQGPAAAAPDQGSGQSGQTPPGNGSATGGGQGGAGDQGNGGSASGTATDPGPSTAPAPAGPDPGATTAGGFDGTGGGGH